MVGSTRDGVVLGSATIGKIGVFTMSFLGAPVDFLAVCLVLAISQHPKKKCERKVKQSEQDNIIFLRIY